MNLENIALNTLQSIQELIYIRDLDRNIIYINKAAEQFTGYSLPEAKGKKCYEIFGDENLRCKESCPVGKAISEQVFLTHNEGKLKTKSGENCYLSVSISPFWEEESITGAVVIMQNLKFLKEKEQTQVKTLVEKEHYINELTQTKNDLQESEKKFRQVVENANEGIFIIQDGRYKFINDYGLRLFKREREELVGAKTLEHVHPDDRHFVSERIERRLSGEPVEDIVEHRIIDANGQVKWVETRGGLTSWDGKTANIGFATDINERKQAEEALRGSEENYRTIFDTANDAIFIHDIQTGEILDVNQRMLDMYEYTEKKALIGQFVETLSSNEVPYTEREAGERVQEAAKGKPQVFEWHAKKKNGQLFWVEVNLKKVSLLGEPRIVALVRDVTERKRAEKALRESENKFRAAFEGSHDAITLTTKDGRVVDCNKRALELYGLESKQDFLDKRPADLSPYLQSNGRASSEASRECNSLAL